MRTELKEGIFIEGFDNVFEAEHRFDYLVSLPHGTMYAGETSSIPEEVAKNCVMNIHGVFKNYYKGFNGANILDRVTAKESIQTACDKKYCIIYKLD